MWWNALHQDRNSKEKDSFDYIHGKCAWPKVQEMFANNVKNGKVKS